GDPARRMRVYISARKLAFPTLCACCLQAADSQWIATATRTSGKRVVRTQSRRYAFPYCTRCVSHLQLWESADSGLVLIATLSLFGALFVWFALNFAAAVGLFVVGSLIGAIFRQSRRGKADSMTSTGCVASKNAVSYLGWDGSIQMFDFASEDFAAEF